MTRQFLPYLQLVRLPNVFTAMADIFLAALATAALPEHAPRFVLLLLASSFLYCSGMVWNDYFDVKQDERERPFRPIPSGKVSLQTAFALGTGLMLLGILFAALADYQEEGIRWFSLVISVSLCAAILLYDGWLKRTWAGPISMGFCRFLNVVLGLSVVQTWVGGWGLLIALVVGVYIVGVTWFARTEARESNQGQLAGATAVIGFALALALAVPAIGPVVRDEDTNLPFYPEVFLGQLFFPYLLCLFGIYLGLALIKAIRRPTPPHVQKAVKRSILGLVALDAILATVFVGPAALTLLVLLVPARYLGKWVYST